MKRNMGILYFHSSR